MRYYYELSSPNGPYYIIDRYSDDHIGDFFTLEKAIWVTKALNEFEDRGVNNVDSTSISN